MSWRWLLIRCLGRQELSLLCAHEKSVLLLINPCQQVLVWHTRTELVNLKKEEKFKELKGHHSDQGIEVWRHNLVKESGGYSKANACHWKLNAVVRITEPKQGWWLTICARKILNFLKILMQPSPVMYQWRQRSHISETEILECQCIVNCDQTDVIRRSSGLLVLLSQNGVLCWRYSSHKTNRIWSFRWISSTSASSTLEWGWVTPVEGERAGISLSYRALKVSQDITAVI